MGRHRSRSRSGSRGHKKHKHYRDHSRDRSKEKSEIRHRRPSRSRSSERRDRRSKFDLDPSGQRGPRRSKWSDQPPDSTQNVYDPNVAKLAAQNLITAITINPEAQNAQNELLNKQAELFGNLLSRAKYETNVDTRVETIRPNVVNMDPIKSALGKDFSGAGIINTLNDTTKIKRKIYIPKDSNFNYVGLIIGPKGANQKRLEEETGCKILVRGKGSQKEGQPPQPDDDEEQHVLIVGENELQLAKATAEIERIMFADEETRNKIRQEQLKLVAQLKNDPNGLSSKAQNGDVDLSMTTPYGPPSADAFVIRVPNDCVGLVIGKSGETIRQLQMQSGAKKVQVAADSNKGQNYRNVFVEGDREAYDQVQKMIKDIVEQQQKIKQAMTGVLPDNTQGVREEVPVPDNLVGLIIGRGGETIKSINQRTGAVVFIPKECDTGKSERFLIVSGTPDQVQQAKQEIQEKVQEGLRNIQLKALQASGVPIQWMTSLGFGDPNLLMQYLSSFDPTYAAMYQQMYAQQPVVTTVTDSATLPGSQSSYQNNNYQQQQQMVPNYSMVPDYMTNYQNQMGMQDQGMAMQGLQAQGLFPNQQFQTGGADLNGQISQQQQQQFYQQGYMPQ
jgi:far upstream element-binding protein